MCFYPFQQSSSEPRPDALTALGPALQALARHMPGPRELLLLALWETCRAADQDGVALDHAEADLLRSFASFARGQLSLASKEKAAAPPYHHDAFKEVEDCLAQIKQFQHMV